MAASRRTFHVADYCVFVLSLLLALAIGIYHAFSGGKQRSRGEYFMGNRQLSMLPVALSLVVTLISANTILGVPAEMYSFGIKYWFAMIGFAPAMVAVAWTFVPLLYPLKITSCYEYLEMRFKSPWPKKLASLLLLVKQVLYIGTVLFGPATALEAVTGVHPAVSIIIVTVVGTVYTTLGGIRGIIWTDVFQACIMYAGLIAVTIQGTIKVGGLSKVWEISTRDKRADLSGIWDFPGRVQFNIWVLFFGLFFHWYEEFGINQPSTQRFCALKSQNMAKIAILLNIPMYAVILSLTGLSGVVAYAYYAQTGCDPLESGQISNSNQILAFFTLEILDLPGLPGLILACIFAASLSTVSSSLNSMAACTWEDFLKHRVKHLSENRITLITKILVAVYGLVCMGAAFIVSRIGGTMVLVSTLFLGVCLGANLGLFLMAAIFPFINAISAVIGAICGLLVTVWLMVGYLLLDLQNQRLPGRTEYCNVTQSNFSVDYTQENLYNSTATMLHSVYNQDFNTKMYNVTSEEFNISGINLFYSLHYLWHPIVGMLVAIAVGIISSLITGRMKVENPALVLPCIRRFIKAAPIEKPESQPMVDTNTFNSDLKM